MGKNEIIIPRKEAFQLAVDYLKDINRKYLSINEENNTIFDPAEKLLYGTRKGEVAATYAIGYEVVWGNTSTYEFITMDANTGEVLYSMSSTRWIEAYE